MCRMGKSEFADFPHLYHSHSHSHTHRERERERETTHLPTLPGRSARLEIFFIIIIIICRLFVFVYCIYRVEEPRESRVLRIHIIKLNNAYPTLLIKQIIQISFPFLSMWQPTPMEPPFVSGICIYSFQPVSCVFLFHFGCSFPNRKKRGKKKSTTSPYPSKCSHIYSAHHFDTIPDYPGTDSQPCDSKD